MDKSTGTLFEYENDLADIMRDDFYPTVIVFAVAMVAILMIVGAPKHGTVAYDCRLAEISPDFPIDVKQQCRELFKKAVNK